MLVRLICLLLAAATPVVAAAPAGAHPQSAADTDHDGFRNPEDNCPEAFNVGQEDTDADGEPPRLPTASSTTGGDACDTDDDGDGVDDALDNCRVVENRDQTDLDGDGEGDLCDTDDDADQIRDQRDNCIKVANPDQADRDDDFIGDVCDPEPGAGPTPLVDQVAPTVVVAVRRRHRVDELRGALAVPVRVGEPCTLVAELSISAATARRLGLGRSRVLARGSAEVGERGRTFVFARLARAALRRIAARRRPVRVGLRLAARDAAGNETILRRTLRVVP